MRKPFTLITLLVLVALILLSCSRQISTESPETTATMINSTETLGISATGSIESQGMVVFSYEEDGYAHLFAYIPEQMPLTRLTSGNWDDITPAASPDGKKIAFASNRNGFWDL